MEILPDPSSELLRPAVARDERPSVGAVSGAERLVGASAAEGGAGRFRRSFLKSAIYAIHYVLKELVGATVELRKPCFGDGQPDVLRLAVGGTFGN